MKTIEAIYVLFLKECLFVACPIDVGEIRHLISIGSRRILIDRTAVARRTMTPIVV